MLVYWTELQLDKEDNDWEKSIFESKETSSRLFSFRFCFLTPHVFYRDSKRGKIEQWGNTRVRGSWETLVPIALTSAILASHH
jgi:hypothetical protein